MPPFFIREDLIRQIRSHGLQYMYSQTCPKRSSFLVEKHGFRLIFNTNTGIIQHWCDRQVAPVLNDTCIIVYLSKYPIYSTIIIGRLVEVLLYTEMIIFHINTFELLRLHH